MFSVKTHCHQKEETGALHVPRPHRHAESHLLKGLALRSPGGKFLQYTFIFSQARLHFQVFLFLFFERSFEAAFHFARRN